MTLVKKRDPKQTLQTKRRFGEHHKKSKTYHKVYWPYLPLLVIALLLVVSGIRLLNVKNSSFNNQDLVGAINQARNNHKYQSLNLNSNLSSLAKVELSQLDNTTNSNSLGQIAKNLIKSQASYSEYGLNLAYGFYNNNFIINGWMVNSTDKQNLLNPDYSEIGLAQAKINYNHKYQRVVIAILAPHQAKNIILKPFVSYGTRSLNLSSVEALGVNNSKTYLFITSLLILILVIILIIRNSKKIVLYLRKGQKYILKHFLVDLILILVIIFLIIILLSVGKVV